MHVCVVTNGLVLSVLILSCSSAEGNRTKNDKHEQMTDLAICDMTRNSVNGARIVVERPWGFYDNFEFL
jgi:hypothetical protein